MKDKCRKTPEDYMEALFVIREKKGYARAIDMARYLKVTPPGVSYAVKRLKQQGYVTSDEAGILFLTAEGRKIAEKIHERHVVLTEILTYMGVDPDTAVQDACRIEHDISDETYRCICSYLKKF